MKTLFLTLAMLSAFIVAFGQNYTSAQKRGEGQSEDYSPSKVYYGGGLNLTFGSITEVGISPLVGYKATPQFSVGSQLTYQYFRYDRAGYDYSATNYGGSLFSRYRFVPQLYGHVEFSMMNYEFQSVYTGSNRDWVPFLFVGGGFSQPISKNTWINAQLLFDVIQDENSPFEDWEPFYTIGIGVGF
ncbi:hypothetical protein [Maribellus sp. YY47]|uniref:hypothetical protein n=1 Tax=Maribellus sp. YY47 TaxID=2929486 RepID=UPI002000D71F|nr:hypothetical protein [Maribellus sp. YY47]MCK3684400.1 hypothetical protein [Maribellus sp. YY47]